MTRTFPVHFPLMGKALKNDEFIFLDLSVQHAALQRVDVAQLEALSQYIDQQRGSKLALGGYAEHRDLYRSSTVFKDATQDRNIHLGVDCWADAGTPVFAPFDGVVHSFKNNDLYRDYGPTIILQHEHEGQVFFSLYGHLSLSDLNGLYPGKPIPQGTAFCHIGQNHENGQWPPHLHLQLILDMQGLSGDYPGVASQQDAPGFLANCPDPMFLFM
jgi:murein DD-endopeptidase MepM/ murein hydrolase activator NlpD